MSIFSRARIRSATKKAEAARKKAEAARKKDESLAPNNQPLGGDQVTYGGDGGVKRIGMSSPLPPDMQRLERQKEQAAERAKAEAAALKDAIARAEVAESEGPDFKPREKLKKVEWPPHMLEGSSVPGMGAMGVVLGDAGLTKADRQQEKPMTPGEAGALAANMLVPGVWLKDWGKMGKWDRALNIALDGITIATLGGGVIVKAVGRGAQATRTAGKVAKAIKEAEEAAGRADAAWKASNLTPNNLVLRGEAEKAQKVAVDRAAQVDKNMVKQATAARVAK